MSFPANQQKDEPLVPKGRAAGSGRTSGGFCRAGVVAVVLLFTGMLAAACGGEPSSHDVASLGTTTTTTASAPKGGSKVNPANSALAFVNCMRTHGEPNMPEPVIEGRSAQISIAAGSGVDPNSPQFAAATKACKHLLPDSGAPKANTITAADQADYLKAVVCMRSHGIPDFPDPVFQNNNVMFITRTPIDTNSAQYKNALATCEKLIPAGLPYSSPGAS
jgi:hypothetical protein